MSNLDAQLERMQADGRITVHDADEVRNFASFLTATAGIPKRNRTAEQRRAFAAAYREHYPEEYALAVAQHQARHTDPDSSSSRPDVEKSASPIHTN